jgi:glutamyl-tRNA synthetase/glutamyl-Q tRNA(Asp) synthetase
VRPDLDALVRRLPPRPLTRFAPSPTGYLHLGHVVNAIYVWGIARAIGGRVLVRIEDHDRVRSRAGFDRAILEDLEWLGLLPDEGVVRQSDRTDVYEEALTDLARSHRVYACECSRREIAAGAPTVPGAESRYPGRCRTRGLAWAGRRGLRVELAPGVEAFDDALKGRVRQDPASECGDLLLRDRDGHWTYQFAAAVDDTRQAVALVIRGEDLLTSTGRQIRLARMLGRADPPVFLHHGLLLAPSGAKLSKSRGDTGVRELRDAGASAADVLGRAAASCGLIGEPRPIPADQIDRLFATTSGSVNP